MTWRPDIIDGPIPSHAWLGIVEDAETGEMVPAYGDLLPGYNLNIARAALTTDELAAVAPHEVDPSHPKRGNPDGLLIYLCFPDEATARAALAAHWIDES